MIRYSFWWGVSCTRVEGVIIPFIRSISLIEMCRTDYQVTINPKGPGIDINPVDINNIQRDKHLLRTG